MRSVYPSAPRRYSNIGRCPICRWIFPNLYLVWGFPIATFDYERVWRFWIKTPKYKTWHIHCSMKKPVGMELHGHSNQPRPLVPVDTFDLFAHNLGNIFHPRMIQSFTRFLVFPLYQKYHHPGKRLWYTRHIGTPSWPKNQWPSRNPSTGHQDHQPSPPVHPQVPQLSASPAPHPADFGAQLVLKMEPKIPVISKRPRVHAGMEQPWNSLEQKKMGVWRLGMGVWRLGILIPPILAVWMGILMINQCIGSSQFSDKAVWYIWFTCSCPKLPGRPNYPRLGVWFKIQDPAVAKSSHNSYTATVF